MPAVNALEPFSIVVVNGELYFNGTDRNGLRDGLWRSNGTALGTIEIGGLNDAGVGDVFTKGNSPGLSPSSLVAFNGEVMFTGNDSDGVAGSQGLWISNGTTTGTTEIGGLADAGVMGAGIQGFDATDLTVFNGKVLFNGLDGDDSHGLWSTTGLAGGTAEFGGLEDAGVTDAAAGGLSPSDMTVFGSEVLFDGDDSSDGFDLWITDGTPTGTKPLGGVDNALVKGAWAGGLGPSDMVVLGGKVYFEGQDSTAALGLWVSDGTPTGTTEIGGLKDEGVGGSPGPKGLGLAPSALIAFNGKLLFAGFDSHEGAGLWVSDGTQTGTTEVGGVDDAQVKDASSIGVDPAFPILFDGEVFFSGKDSDNDFTLWETNGTATGTVEIGGLGNAQIAGAGAKGLDPSNFVIDGSELFFDAVDANGGFSLWATNGTVKGTFEIAGVGVPGDVFPAREDYNGAGVSDLLIESTTGQVEVGQIGSLGAAQSGGKATYKLVANLGSTWTLRGDGDFLNNGDTQFLIESSAGAVEAVGFVGGATTFKLLADAPTSWSFREVGDFLGTGYDQFLIQEPTGAMIVSDYVGGKEVSTSLGALASTWRFVGAGDFLGEGHDQFLIEDAAGALMAGDRTSGATHFTLLADLATGWKIVGTGDFLSVGETEFLVQAPTGVVYIGEVGPNHKVTYIDMATLSPSEWKFVGTGNYLNEGHTQFLIEDTAGALLVGDYVGGTTHFTLVSDMGSQWTFH